MALASQMAVVWQEARAASLEQRSSAQYANRLPCSDRVEQRPDAILRGERAGYQLVADVGIEQHEIGAGLARATREVGDHEIAVACVRTHSESSTIGRRESVGAPWPEAIAVAHARSFHLAAPNERQSPRRWSWLQVVDGSGCWSRAVSADPSSASSGGAAMMSPDEVPYTE
jgi:hypothetical protein